MQFFKFLLSLSFQKRLGQKEIEVYPESLRAMLDQDISNITYSGHSNTNSFTGEATKLTYEKN